MTTVQKTGDWAKARRLLTAAPHKLKVAVDTALRQEALALRKEIVQGITRQAPSGQSFKPLSPLTLAARRYSGFKGTRALIRRADLRNAITAVVRGGTAFIGVPRKARSKEGEPMVDIAKLNEFGSDPIVIPMTPRMRRYLFALLRAAGKKPTGGSGKGVVVVRIPARPFLRPAFEKFKHGAGRRFMRRVARRMGMRGV
jgi:hypothetical protein